MQPNIQEPVSGDAAKLCSATNPFSVEGMVVLITGGGTGTSGSCPNDHDVDSLIRRDWVHDG